MNVALHLGEREQHITKDGSGTGTSVKMTHVNTKHHFTASSNKLVPLDFNIEHVQHSVIPFHDQPQQIYRTTHKKGKVPDEEQTQKMSVFYSVSISRPAERKAPIVSTVVGMLSNLSGGVLLKGRLDAAIGPIMRL